MYNIGNLFFKKKLLEYQIQALILKALYQNGSYVFSNGTVADSTAVSTLVIIHFGLSSS
jgi:hypothetical protein